MQEYLIISAFIAFVVALVAWGIRENQKQRIQKRQAFNDIPFGSASSEEKMYELNNVYQANKVRSQRNLDG